MANHAAGLGTQIFNNHLKSAVLLAGFPFLLVLMLGGFFSATNLLLQYTASYHASPHNARARHALLDWPQPYNAGLEGIVNYGHWAVLVAGLWFSIAYFFHGRMMRMATGSVPITRQEMPRIYNMLENLCISRGIPMPQFELIDSPALNAFATGIDPKSYRIVLTRGLLETLPDDELESVIGHELTHVMNGDVRLLIISVIFVGMISFFAQMTARAMLRGRRRSGRDSRGGATPILLVALAILAIGYIFAVVIRFALSRQREYLADAGSVDLTKNPAAMMKALLRISGHDEIPGLQAEVQQMCIENSHNFMGVFATHPSIAERIKTISDMTGTPVPDLYDDNPQATPTHPWGSPEGT